MLRRAAKVQLRLKTGAALRAQSNGELIKLGRGRGGASDVRAGRVITREGEKGRDFVAIVEGSAVVERKGRRINRLGAGDFFGEIALVTGEPRTATVTAETDLHAPS